MTTDADDPKVENNEAENRFEVRSGDLVAVLLYEKRGSVIILQDTQVPEPMGGRGIGGRLAQAGLEYAKANNLKAVPLCPFVAAYLNRHPEYEDVVARDAS